MRNGLHQPENARVLYLDMNSFFASVEQQENPALRGIPMAVVSHIGPAGTVLAASYEAKAFGIRTGLRLKEAWEILPTLKTLVVGVSNYKNVHKRFMAILEDLTGPEVRARSIDEAVIPLSVNWYGSERAHTLAREIKQRFRAELGEYIKCSIGIAPNSFLGKLATDLQKPDGLVEITLENTPEILSRLELPQLPGIAQRMTSRLRPWGIATPLDLYTASAADLSQWFGIWGQYWWWKLHGYEADAGDSRLKSMSHQHALKHWTTSREALFPVFDRMTDRLIHRLRRNHLQCNRIGIWVSLKDRRGIGIEQDLGTSNQSYGTLIEGVHQLFARLPNPLPAQVRLIGIYFLRLTPAISGQQINLFDTTQKNEALSRALEIVRGRHGFESIQRGTVIRLDPTIAAERLGFGRVKDL